MKTAFPALIVAAAWTAIAPPAAAQQTEMEIGYMPILPVSQLFVGLETGAIEEAGITADLVEFQNGPAMVQALLAGQLDVAYLGIGPAMVARGRGADIKVVASNVVEQISIVALPALAGDFADKEPAEAFAAFEAREGRKPVIATFPVGSVPQTVLQYWIRRELGISPDAIETIYQGASQVQQALLTGAVDGAAILEPIVSTTLDRVEGAQVVAAGSELFPNQPGAVLAVREALLADNPEAVDALVAAHIAATEQLSSDPAGTAPMVGKYVGGGRLPEAVIEAAITRSAEQFVADPNRIIEGTQVMHDFQAELGTLAQPVDLDALFDLDVYDRASSK
ncbi:ABC transporter substrate-binding protein [Profundibacterium mesophilum]|uniref:Nitratesulfonatebicarbonate ABC transporter periplasmic components-like protein n=1 Tax=Profundibacterium mesophilum KAUST100406-0324 TaxID=1037889 RepID=A0A921TCD9_9RHOB|nr:ABC transporter substrate-binding protein [Profundibacterium mesophilum]KAF0675016.1 nitratesulfonatebicarbonate ABC transporter periplasmic components-like protein [Profundibacterium mesophilum KAUST100406-0324]